MYKNILRISVLAVTLLVTHACNDALEIVNPNRISADGYYANQDDAVAAVDAIYNTIITDGWYQRITPIYNDGRGDELTCRSPWGFMTGFSNFTLAASDGAGDIFWTGHYITVNRANQVLENIPDIPDLDSDLANRLLGQAYFLRALAYFKLANQYGTIPLITHTPSGADEFYPSNEGITKEIVYDQVILDLEAAAGLLPLNYSDVTGPDQGQVGRATRGAAQAMLGKVHLYEGNYASAATNFNAVISSGEYSLASNYADIFSGDPALEQADPGKIFWAEFTDFPGSVENWGGDPNVNWRQFIAIAPTYSVADFFDFFPSSFLYNEMRSELTNTGTLDERYHATILSFEPTEGYDTAYGGPWPYAPTDYFIKKFTLAATGGDPFFASINYPVIRYADVLLMYAECLANTGDISGAAAHVQTVRNRADLPDREAEFATYSLTQFMDQISHERIMELGIEGSRWFDIMRWGWLDDATRLAQLQANDPEFGTFVPDRKVIPIPLAELNRNLNLIGNSAND